MQIIYSCVFLLKLRIFMFKSDVSFVCVLFSVEFYCIILYTVVYSFVALNFSEAC